jgi:hypothetical protein
LALTGVSLPAQAQTPPQQQATLEIALAHGNEAEQLTRAQLRSLLSSYDLCPWLLTRKVNIEAQVIPHSHPTLTLNTRHLNRDDLLLSTLIHEELHWYLAAHEQEANAAMADLRALFPKIPVGYPESSSDEAGNYEHLIVIYAEYQADRELLGEEGAGRVMDFWVQDHYTWLYKTVLSRGPEIGAILKAHKLSLPTAKSACPAN